MKIRIKSNSIRFRLTKTEVDHFSLNGFIEETTAFVNNSFSYRLEITNQADSLSASYHDDKITIHVPKEHADQWISTDMIGIEHKMSLGKDNQLFLLIEKDFVCLDNTFEDQSDNYPNPNAVC